MLVNKTNNQNLLLELYNHSQHSKPLLTVKLQDTRKRYQELELFKQHIEMQKHGLALLPYSSAKAKVFTYRMIFFGLGVMFALLSCGVMMTSPSFPILAHAGIFFTLRNLFAALSLLMGLFALGIAASMRSDHEAAKYFLRAAKNNLARSYKRKKIEIGLNGFFFFGKDYKKLQLLKQSYHDAEDQLHEHCEELYHLFERISNSSFLNPRSREHLYNQAILEYNDQAKSVVKTFQQR